MAGWVPGPVWTGAKNLAPTEIRSQDRPARCKSLYRLSYPGPESLQAQDVITFSNFEVILPNSLPSHNGSQAGQARHPHLMIHYGAFSRNTGHEAHFMFCQGFLATGTTSYSDTLLEFPSFLPSDRTLCSRGRTYCVVSIRHARQPIAIDLKVGGGDVRQQTQRHVPGLRRAVRAAHYNRHVSNLVPLNASHNCTNRYSEMCKVKVEQSL